MPKNEAAKSVSKSFFETGSDGVNKDVIQKAAAANNIRKADVASGENHSGIRLFAIGMFNPNKIAVINTAKCPIHFSFVIWVEILSQTYAIIIN